MTDHPEKLGKYLIRRELGRGAMGVVFDAWDPSIERHVALKTVRRDQLEASETTELLDRFKREAQAAGRLSHPNIVSVYEYGEDAGTAFIAMEYVEGRELKDYFDRNERFSLIEIARIMSELLDALALAHAAGVVHRDIKPANIFILNDGRVKVGDFGIARIESSNLTQTGSVLGTPAYMSPEQFMGQTVDGRSDIFSAGVILYQFLTGEKPFTGQLTTIMHKVLREDPVAPSELNVQVPQGFDSVMRKALAKRPDDRYQNAREFAQAIQAAAAGAVVTGDDATVLSAPDTDATQVSDSTLPTLTSAPRPAAPAPAASQYAAPPPPSTSPSAPPRGETRKPSPALTFAVVGGLLLAGLGAGAYWMNRPPGAPSNPSGAPASSAAAPAAPAATVTAEAHDNGFVISAVGFADPSNPRYSGDAALLRTDLREDAKRQLVEKAVALLVQQGSMTQNYDLLRNKLFNRSNEFIDTVIQENPPQTGKDGLMSLTTRASVRVRDVQKSLNQMSRDERVEFIRNNGDPKISVAINTKTEYGETERSPIAENLLKERILSFGFRTWSDERNGEQNADFAVTGEAKFKKLSAKLAASGITIERTVLTSWSVKCTDKKTGEDLYFNTQIPEKQSWVSEEAALADIGKLIGEEFSKNFFLQHFHFVGQKLKVNFSGLPDKESVEAVQREMTGLRAVLDVKASGGQSFEIALAGSGGAPADWLAGAVIQPLNHKFGRTCLSVDSASGKTVNVAFDAACKEANVLGRLDSLPAAALFEAPAARRSDIVKNPETLKKLSI